MVIKEQISGSQLAFILIPVVAATAFMSVPGAIYQFSKEDAWISYLLSLITGVWTILAFTTLALRHPGMTLVQYSEKILGKWFGKVIGLYYIYFLFLFPTIVAGEDVNFITLFALPQTPQLVTMALFFLVCGIGAWLGIEVIVRCSELLVPLSIIFSVIITVLLIPEMTPKYLQPVLGHGMLPVLQGAVMPSGWAGEFFVLGFLLPYLNDLKKARMFSFIGLAVVMLIMLMVILESIMIDGPLTGQLKYAYYTAVRYISIGDFLERIDPVIVGVWVYNGFLKTALFLWAFVLCVAQVFDVTNYRILVLPLTLSCIVGGLWMFLNEFEMSNWFIYSFPIVSFISQNLLPTLILLVDVVHSRKGGKYA